MRRFNENALNVAFERALGYCAPFSEDDCQLVSSLVVMHARDISELTAFPNLRRLEIFASDALDLAAFSVLKELEVLKILCTPLPDTQTIGELRSLKEIELNFTSAQDITPILALPNLTKAVFIANPLCGASYNMINALKLEQISSANWRGLMIWVPNRSWTATGQLFDLGYPLCSGTANGIDVIVKPGRPTFTPLQCDYLTEISGRVLRDLLATEEWPLATIFEKPTEPQISELLRSHFSEIDQLHFPIARDARAFCAIEGAQPSTGETLPVGLHMNKGQLQHQSTLRSHEEAVNGVITLDSSRLLSWSDDATLRIWSLNDASPTQILRGHDAQVNHALSLTEGLITSTAYDGSLCVWDAKTGVLRRKIMRPDLTFMGTAYWKPNHVVSYDLEGNLIPWNIVTGQKISTLEEACYNWGPNFVECPFFLLPTRGVAVTWPLLDLLFWDLQTGECIHAASEHKDAPEAYLMPDGRILTWSNDGALKIWSAEGMVLATLRGHENDIGGAFVLDNGNIVSWMDDGTVRIWDTQTMQCKWVFVHHEYTLIQVWPLSTNLLLSQALDGRCYVWNTQTGQLLTTFESGNNGNGIVLSTSRFLNWRGSTMNLWDLNSGECVQTLNEHQGTVSGAKLINPKTVVTWSTDATLRLWEITS